MTAHYLRLSEAPQLVTHYPTCGACYVETDNDGDGFTCPNCGTAWSNDAGDGDLGDLYESWSGEQLGTDVFTEDEASEIALYRERLDRHQKFGGKYPALYPKPWRVPAALARLGDTR